MPRAIWKGSINIGLVSVPVKLYSAVRPQDVRFNELHATDAVRIKHIRVCSKEEEEVPFEEIVKGYEIAPDQYVLIEPGELEALDPKKTKTIEISDFVDLDAIDPIFYDHPYYLAPAAGGAKPYRLLHEAMTESRKVAIAKVVIRQKENLVAIRAMEGGVLGMSTMIFADEVVPPDRIDDLPDDVETSKQEVDMAQMLIDSLAADFEPEKYQDTYREEVIALIERKAEGKEIAVQPAAEEEAAPVPDLMAALKASLDAVQQDGKKQPEKPAAKKKAPAKKKTAAKR